MKIKKTKQTNTFFKITALALVWAIMLPNCAWAGGEVLPSLPHNGQTSTLAPHINIDVKTFQQVYHKSVVSVQEDVIKIAPVVAKKSIAKTAKNYGVAALVLLGIRGGLSFAVTFWFDSFILTFAGIGLTLAGFFGWQKMEAWLLPRLEKRVLVTEGPYQWAQHPFYTIQMLLPLGIFLAFPSQLALMTLYAFCLDALIRILYEHRHLYSQYGEAYRRYQQSGIPLLIPKFIPLMQYFANEIKIYTQTNYIYKNIFPKGTPGIEDILNAQDKISALDKINELRMLYPEIVGYYKADQYFTLFTDKEEITFKDDNGRIDISMISVDDENAQTTVVPLTDEYVIDTPFEVFKDEIIDNGKFEEERFKASMEGNIFWEAPLGKIEKENQQQEIVKRAKDLSVLTTDIRDYFSQKFPSLEIVNISVHGGAIYGFPGVPVSDIDLVVIVKGKCLEYWEFPFESVIAQGTLPIGSPEINFMIIGEENLQNPRQDYVHIRRHRLINIVESDVCTAPWRFVTLWGKDWEKTDHLENNLKIGLVDLENSARYKIDQAVIAAAEASKDAAKFLKQACGRIYEGYLIIKKFCPSLLVDFNEIIALQRKTAREKTSLYEAGMLLKKYQRTINNIFAASIEKKTKNRAAMDSLQEKLFLKSIPEALEFLSVLLRKTDKEGILFSTDHPINKNFAIKGEKDLTGKDVLVLGCGAGMACFGAFLAGANRVVGVDLDENSINIAKTVTPLIQSPVLKQGLRERYPKINPIKAKDLLLGLLNDTISEGEVRLEFPDNVEFKAGDASNLSFLEDGSFDLVSIPYLVAMDNGILQEEKIRQTLQEAVRVLRPKGRLVLTPFFDKTSLERTVKDHDSFGVMLQRFGEEGFRVFFRLAKTIDDLEKEGFAGKRLINKRADDRLFFVGEIVEEAPLIFSEDIDQIAGQVVNALNQGDFDEAERLFGIFQSENIAEPRLDNAWIAKITEEIWQYIKEKAGSIDEIRNMDPEEFAQKTGAFTTEAALMPFVLDQPTAKLLKKIRQLYGGKGELWQKVEIPILPLFQYPHAILIMHPSIEKAGIYYSPNYMKRNDATLLNKSLFFHELLEKKFLENGIIDRRFNYIFSHIHPRIIEEELKFAEVMGELPVMLALRKGQLRAKSLQIEKELAKGKLGPDRAQDFIESAEWLEDALLLYDQEADFFLEQGQSLASEDQVQVKASMDKALQSSLTLINEQFRSRAIEQSI